MNNIISNNDEKPFNICLDCAFLGKKCDGPNFLSMPTSRRAEWCRLRKNNLYKSDPKWTNDYIADVTGLSKSSVDRFFRGELEDIRASTLSMILSLLINDVDGSWKKSPCAMGAINVEVDEGLKAHAQKLEHECERLHNIIAADEDKKAFLAEQIKIKDKQNADLNLRMAERTEFLKRKDISIGILIVLLALSLGFIFIGLIMDIINPAAGFFWLN